MPNIDVNGQTIDYPDIGDSNWGDNATNFAIQTSAALGKIGLSSGTSVDITQTLDVTGNTTLDANLSVGGDTSVTGNTTLTGNLSVGGNASVTGTTSFTGNVTLTNNLTVNGNTQLGNANTDTIGVTGIVNVDAGTLYVDPVNNRVGINKTSPAQALDVTGDAAITGNFAVDTNTLYVDATNNRVGINNTTPTVALDVTGDMNVSGIFNQMPVGTIIASVLQNAPTGFLLCDGSNTVSRTTYANLFSAIAPNKGTVTITIATPGVVTLNSHGFLTGESIYLTTTGALPTGLSVDTLYYVVVNDANSFWLATSYNNAIANTRITTSGSQSGTHTLFYCPYGLGSTTSNFKLPDQKNSVFRGRGLSTGFTSNGTTRMGFLENDQFQGHAFYTDRYAINASGGSHTYPAGGLLLSTGFNITSIISDGTNGTPRTGLETRMKNQGVNFFIKF